MAVVSGIVIKNWYSTLLSEATQLDIRVEVAEHSEVDLTYRQPH